MKKPIEEITFCEIDGIWQRVDSQSQKPTTLAEWLTQWDMVVDDRLQFGRFYDYNKGIYWYWRVDNSRKIHITIWKLND